MTHQEWVRQKRRPPGACVAKLMPAPHTTCPIRSEETINAAVSGPLGIISAVGVSAVFGWAFIFALVFSIQVSPATWFSTSATLLVMG